MKLTEIVKGPGHVCVPISGVLYHCTTMHMAAEILRSGFFKLKKVPRSKPPRYVMSTSPDLTSDFIDMMHGPGSVILTLNGNAFAAHGAQMAPYICPDARDEFGDSFDEKEIQLVYKAPTLAIPKPIHKAIPHIQVGVGRTDPSGTAHYNEQQLAQFYMLCQQLKVSVSTDKFER